MSKLKSLFKMHLMPEEHFFLIIFTKIYYFEPYRHADAPKTLRDDNYRIDRELQVVSPCIFRVILIQPIVI